MATDLDTLTATRTLLYQRLNAAAASLNAAGGKPNATGDGAQVDHAGFIDKTLAQIDAINKQIELAQGPFELYSQGL